MTAAIGIDFGTTNSVVSVLAADGRLTTARFPAGVELVETFRSVLCFWTEQPRDGGKLRHAAGPDAIEAYLDDPLDSRLIMSMKTYLAQRSFTETRIAGRTFSLEGLVAQFLRSLLDGAGISTTDVANRRARIIVGRPVRFAGELADDSLGEARLRGSYAEAGLADVDVALEPEAAGWRFARTLNRAATVLIGDFGGGTSDFSLLRFEPGKVVPLGHAGIGIAGDLFDFRIIDRVISPRLGKGDVYRIMGKELPVPPEYFSRFARWHQMSLMRNPRTLREIGEVARASADPTKLRHLMALIEDELGYRLYQTVAAVKAALSHHDSAELRFTHKQLDIARRITRAEFEEWIAPELASLAATIDRALVTAGLAADAVDHVFLTGGTSFVPSVRRLFEDRFGAAKVAAGGEFVSVAEGLALIGRDRGRTAKMTIAPTTRATARGFRAHASGLDAEVIACAALERDGWRVLGRRLRTPAGEIDVVAERDGLVAFVEVKQRPTLAGAAAALSARQRLRLMAAAEILLALNPDWGAAGVRFDVLVVDQAGAVRRIADAFRDQG